ncbi:methylated-DNA--[protein]-cysteine S-methyltransferase [Sphingomonas echinoides]|uniref:methylated-DNA--[protein]-cysteine S-methyltransferase n=1 Tax=Sphingomonas echinoides TaxID=59803 RepID=UPI0024139143|nr:methylated-DNA--[protein]-cysteine S-methyltransferase [Sphingomonas echinoides]
MTGATVPGVDRLSLSRVDSPIGEILLVTDAQGRLRALDFHDYAPRMHRLLERHYGLVPLQDAAPPTALRAALEAYFAGRFDALDTVDVATGGTVFQRRVWAQLRHIGAGTTTSYGALAKQLASAGAARAVGAANGLNPVAIVVPCHRVIGANAALTGFGGGIDRKRWLLEHENAVLRLHGGAGA